MHHKRLQALYGLKYDPFAPSVPLEGLWLPPGADHFCTRMESLVQTGGFAVITGQWGVGKSKALHLVAHRLDRLPDVVVGVMERPQNRLSDFYRELGDRFEVNLSPANRYGGFKTLRIRWRSHIKSTLYRPVLLVDEAQEAPTECLNELRLLGSSNFDSESLLTTVLCGDSRLMERFRAPDLAPLGSRIRTRLVLQPLTREELREFLDHSLEQAGAPHLMSTELKEVLCEHAAGNLRVLCNMSAELLVSAAERELPLLDDKLYLEVFSAQQKRRQRKPALSGAAR